MQTRMNLRKILERKGIRKFSENSSILVNRGLPNIAQLLTPQALLCLLQLDRKTSGGEDVAAIRLHRLTKLDFIVERGEGHLFMIMIIMVNLMVVIINIIAIEHQV